MLTLKVKEGRYNTRNQDIKDDPIAIIAYEGICSSMCHAMCHKRKDKIKVTISLTNPDSTINRTLTLQNY